MTNDTFPYKSVYEFLSKYDLLDADHEKIQQAKSHYWKLYRQFYALDYRRRMKTVSVVLPRDQYEDLKARSSLAGLRPSQYMREAILHGKEPVSKSSLEILQGLRRVHTDILNIVRSKFRKGLDFQREIHSLANRVEDLEDLVRSSE